MFRLTNNIFTIIIDGCERCQQVEGWRALFSATREVPCPSGLRTATVEPLLEEGREVEEERCASSPATIISVIFSVETEALPEERQESAHGKMKRIF